MESCDTESSWNTSLTQQCNSSHNKLFHIRTDINEQVGYRVAAIRELFEETGLLLATSSKIQSSNKPSYSTPTIINNDTKLHGSISVQVHNNASEFSSQLQSYSLQPDINKLIPWCRWITPRTQSTSGKQQIRRYDTYFYLTCIESIHAVTAELNEVSSVHWFSPDEALQLAREKKIQLPPPTTHTLYELSKHNDIDQFLSLNPRSIHPIIPSLVQIDEQIISALPGDRLWRIPAHTEDTKYAANIPVNGYNRIYRLANGSWRVVISNVLPDDVPRIDESKAQPLAKL